jgi:hypothetical protein
MGRRRLQNIAHRGFRLESNSVIQEQQSIVIAVVTVVADAVSDIE